MTEPVCKIDSDGNKRWWLNGELHRTDGPAVEHADGSKAWYLNGGFHRVGGPAIEECNGHKEWWFYDHLHRLDGPAIEYPDGRKEWFMSGEEYSFENYILKLEERGLRDNIVKLLFNLNDYR